MAPLVLMSQKGFDLDGGGCVVCWLVLVGLGWVKLGRVELGVFAFKRQ